MAARTECTGDAYYTVNATAGQTYSGYNFDDFQVPTCAPTNVSYTVTNSSGKVYYSGTALDGNTQQGDTVTATFTVTKGMSDQLTLVSYVAPGSSFSDSTAYQQEIYQSATGTFSAGTYSLKVTIPNSYYQIDFVCGQAINQLEPIQNGDAYGPDSAEILFHAEDRYIDSDNGGTTCPSATSLNTTTTLPATLTASATPTSPLTDSATLSYGYNPTGTVTFYLFAPGVTPNASDSNNVYSDSVAVSGDGSYSTASGTNPGGYVPTIPGTFEWLAVYSGDANNTLVHDTFGDEPECVTGKASPTITTTPNTAAGTCGTAETLKDTATLSGGDAPTGSITFTLYSPSGTLLDTATVNVSGNGSYTSPGYSLTTSATPGTYQWDASYTGDNNNNVAVDNNDPSEQVVVGLASPTITTTPNTTTGTCGTSETLKDTAMLSGGDAPTGTITFTLYSPSGTLLDTATVSVSGDGSYTSAGYSLPTTAAAGTYQWDASYNGNTDNSAVIDNGATNEQVVVSQPVGEGQCGSNAFWCSSGGQSLIKCLNTGSSCTNLGTGLPRLPQSVR